MDFRALTTYRTIFLAIYMDAGLENWEFYSLFSFICWHPSKKGLRITLIDKHLQYQMSQQFTFIRIHVTMNNGAQMLISTSIRTADL